MAPFGSPPAPRQYTLHPGDVVLAERGDRLDTLLGSCVAIVLTDPRRTLAAMCHVVHARLPDSGAQDGNTAFGECAMAAMATLLLGRGIAPSLCEAFVVGGGNMFPGLVTEDAVGERNTDWAHRALARGRIAVVLQDTGGNTYRRFTWTVGDSLPEVRAVQV